MFIGVYSMNINVIEIVREYKTELNDDDSTK